MHTDRKQITLPHNPEQLMSLVEYRPINGDGQELEIFNALGNMYPEVLAKVPRMRLSIGSGEPLSEGSDNRLDCGETLVTMSQTSW